ncbi:MAG: histidine phosphatase family protein [Humidesulfovibrio sp.]|uniref:histidine phosphatase family protein n=1 Tax=Humidesulfovibrio sp. TaxID=2910988 RepID=UPI0027EA8D48|nr:histidine phosphatase family protein [Humidesulfovibrio sp.]MDQ7836124.1 histidine phosphatase family protein [Humidesulfovibrio sp.]
MTAVLLMRHGQIVQEPQAPDGTRRFVGDRDLPLDDVGRAQGREAALALARLGDGYSLRRAVSSDLSRSRDTLALAVAGLDPAPSLAVEPGLREISVGQWQGLYPEEVRRLTPGGFEARGADLAGYRPPGGENYNDVTARAMRALTRLAGEAHAEGEGPCQTAVLAVAHAGVNRAVLCAALELPLSRVLALPQDYGCLNLLDFDGERFTVRAINLRPAALAPGWLAASLR